MRDLPEKVYIDRGPRGGLMFRDTRMPDTIAVYVPEDRIAQLERELAEARKDIEFLQSGKDVLRDSLQAELAAEKALSDRLLGCLSRLSVGYSAPNMRLIANEGVGVHRKARKL